MKWRFINPIVIFKTNLSIPFYYVQDGEMNITSKEPQLRLIVDNVEDQHATCTITAQVAV